MAEALAETPQNGQNRPPESWRGSVDRGRHACADDFLAARRRRLAGGPGTGRRPDEELDGLPRVDGPLAVEVYRRLAVSAHPADREAVAVRIDLLLAVDRGTAAEIWRTLLVDSERVIRHAAYETLELARDEVQSGSADVAALAAVLPPADLVGEP